MAKKVCRTITADYREKINRLVDILYPFLPFTAQNKKVITFQKLFAESAVAKYFPQETNKKLSLQKGFIQIFRYHERLPKTLVRKIVPAAIEYRKYKRDPLKREELEELIKCLSELGVDMKEELDKVELDERLPKIFVPPEKLKDYICNYSLEEEISGEPVELFCNGHFNEAIRKACEKLEHLVQTLTNQDNFGKDLMARAFSNENLLNIDKLQPENKSSFIEGYRFMAMGTMGAIRNVFSHADEEKRKPEECFEILLFLNWMLRAIKK